MTFPLGADGEFFALGGGGGVSGNFSMPFFRPLSLGLETGYLYAPLTAEDAAGSRYASLSFLAGGAQAGLNLGIGPRIILYAFGNGGYFFTFLNDDTTTLEGNPYVGGGAGASFRIIDRLSLGVEGNYRNYLGLYNSMSLSIGATVHFGEIEKLPERKKRVKPVEEKPEPLDETYDGEGVDLIQTEFVNIFPVFFKYYDSNPIGTAVIGNFEKRAAENIKVSLYVKQYMDNPKEAAIIDVLEPGEQRKIDLYGLFTSEVLSITEGTKVSALIDLTYQYGGKEVAKEFIETIRLNNRNAVTWDDDRKACAFVTAKDPAVLKFSKNVVGWINPYLSPQVNKNMQLAVGLHEALDLYGVSYVIDPTTPYIEFSENELAIDYLQFPNQTLEFLAGDCDDLSILYSSLLEAAGIETAFVTTPGHIFIALNLEMSPEEAKSRFLQYDDLIFKDGKTWLPVEITERRSGFVNAWRTGAKEWRENEPKGQAGFFPMHEAWKIYEPVGFPSSVAVTLPDKDGIVGAFVKEIDRFVKADMGPQREEILAKIKSTQGDVRWVNKLGVLYAKYGMLDRAMEQFAAVLKQKEYLPALINMGNLYYMQDELSKAKEYYDRASALSPDNPKVLLAVARVDHELENYGTARQAYAKLKELSPELADRFAYLDLRGSQAARAADPAQLKGVVLWEEE